ncbi:uncharacterized protein LOC122243152 [Penaeus japonicus]|uniref:uncharacterized protein LOC122243152 n=1 Tax=Penaeus japonicus TaxID=27405 RepID=UPI001C70B53E|nr:uncharacterized protein LOC122243152 [Penaeus japonicus]
MATPACKEEISKAWLEVILTQYESKAKAKSSVTVTRFQVNPGVKPGENFSSQLVKILVEARVSNGDQAGHISKTYNLLAKFLQGNAFFREVAKKMNGPIREVMIYRDVMPALNQFQSERGDGNNKVDIPGFVHGVCVEGEFVLVMEDIRLSGYENNDKIKGLNHKQILLATEKLATVHAVSFAYNKIHDFTQKFPQFIYLNKVPRQLTNFIMIFYDQCIKHLTMIKYNDSIVEKLRTNRAHFKQQILSLLLPENQQIKCLCHGDYWNNNFMFKSTTAEGLSEPDAIMLVDWGNPQWYTPILDLQYLIHTSTLLDFRKKHREEVMQHYHSTFTEITTKLGAPAPFWTYEVFKEECQRARIYGTMMGMTVNMITLAKHSETNPLVPTTAVDSSSVGWKVGRRLGTVMAPFFLSKIMEPFGRSFFLKFLEPLFSELSAGKNEVLNTRFYDLLNEANEDGVFDVQKS